MIDEIIIGFKDAVGEPVIAEKLPDVFDWVEFGARHVGRCAGLVDENQAFRVQLALACTPLITRLGTSGRSCSAARCDFF